MNNDSKKKLYKKQVAALNFIINRWDPYSLIEEGSPSDEFSNEVSNLLALLKTAKTEDNFAEAVSNVFSKTFETESFDKEQCSKVGKEIHLLWSKNSWISNGRHYGIEAERLLPEVLLSKASFKGNEYAWKIHDIPAVIEGAKSLNLVNLGGQLQFRFQDATCECYWVEVDVLKYKTLDHLSWTDKVLESSVIAKKEFDRVKKSYDFFVEGKGFWEDQKTDDEINEAMCFVWYLEAQNS